MLPSLFNTRHASRLLNIVKPASTLAAHPTSTTHTHIHTQPSPRHHIHTIMADNSNDTASNDANTTTTDLWSAWPQILNTCDRCEVEFDSIEETHTNLCGVCQHLFAADEAVVIACSACSYKYDCMKEGSGSFCGICVHHQPDTENTTAIAPLAAGEAVTGPRVPTYQTPPPAPPPIAPPSRRRRRRSEALVLLEGERLCQTCGRIYKPNKNNTSLDCTWCCNLYAGKGTDLFAKVGLPRTRQAEEAMQRFFANQAAGYQVAQTSSSIVRQLPSAFQSKATGGGKSKISKAEGKKRKAETLNDENLEEEERSRKRIKTEEDGE